jgi:predicted PurR-regulated permease PerM
MSEETVDPHFKQNVETEYERAWHDDYFLRRVLTIAGIAVAIICFFLFIAATFNGLLLVFSGILVAMFLDSVRDKVAEFTGLNDHLSLAIVVGTLVVLVAGGTILFGPKIVHQLREINERIPRADFELRQELVRYEFGRDIVKVMPSRIEIANMLFSGGNERSVYTQLTGVFSTTFSIITNVVIISFIGIYLAIEPETYLGNVLRLVPEKHQPRAREVLQNIATKTKSWFLSRFFSMFVVGILTTVGLRILGVPLAMTLGFIAGLLSFIPTFGPIISLVPAALIGLI